MSFEHPSDWLLIDCAWNPLKHPLEEPAVLSSSLPHFVHGMFGCCMRLYTVNSTCENIPRPGNDVTWAVLLRDGI